MSWLGPEFVRAVNSGVGIAMTGPGSWLGQAFLDLLVRERTLPAPSRLRLFGSTARPITLGIRSQPVERLAGAPPLSGGPWLLLHFAFLGKERTGEVSVADFLVANNAILDDTLRVAQPASDLRVVFMSSGAVYDDARHLRQSAEASPYGWCKVDHERRLTDWCAPRGTPLVIERLFNIGGPFINKVESYALSAMILSARAHGVIRIAAQRPTFRSFVHVNEALGVACDAALVQPACGPLIFDTAGDRVVEMADLAAAVVKAVHPAPVQIERAAMTEGKPECYVGDRAAYAALLRTQNRIAVSLESIISHTDADLAIRGDGRDRA